MRSVVHTIASIGVHNGGPSRSVSGLCDALVYAGARVSLVTLDKPGEKVLSPALAELVQVVEGKSCKRALSMRLFKKLLLHIIRETGASLVHDHGIWLRNNHTTALICHKLDIPRVVSPRGMLEPWALSYKNFKKRLAWNSYQRSDLASAAALHATSEMEAFNIRRLGFQQPIAVIPNGIAMPDGNALRKAVKKKQVLFLSRLHPIKGLPNLISAWAQLQPVDWKLVIAGPDEENHREEIRHLIDEKRLWNSIELLGEVNTEEKWQLLEASQLLVLPSYSENFGVVVAEALVKGVPVIATHGTPWRELENDGCGWWIETGVESLTKALREAFSMNEDVLRAMGERGSDLIAKKYSWTTIGKDMLDFYEWLTSGGTAPSYLYD